MAVVMHTDWITYGRVKLSKRHDMIVDMVFRLPLQCGNESHPNALRLVLRHSRVLLTQQLKRLMHDLLGYGLAMDGVYASFLQDAVSWGQWPRGHAAVGIDRTQVRRRCRSRE